MSVEVEHLPEGAVVARVSGPVDQKLAERICESLVTMASGPVIFDLTAVPLVDPTFGHSIRDAAQTANTAQVALVSPRLTARKILRMSVGGAASVCSTIREALDAIAFRGRQQRPSAT